MTDFWGFLLQTLTASGAAALLLVVKTMFRDKLSPRWQFAVWGVLGAVLLLPAGLGGRYALINWPWLVETAKTFFTGEYSLTHVTAPVPLPVVGRPEGAADWLFLGYCAGVILLLSRYALAYVRLRQALRRGTPAGAARTQQIQGVAERYGLKYCAAVEVPGLPSAFLCGVVSPVLALPAGEPVDDKVILHELLHLRGRDVVWGLIICLFRCVHWCNPLLWYCANRAGNDLEALCDQRVLERLEGEERRDYGRILLSMADERYARAPGTSSMANGGRNIRRRIESIARFKRYPKGMALVSVCVAVTLAAPMLFGVQAKSVYEGDYQLKDDLRCAAALASARTTRCTTSAGALDAYAKAVLDRNGIYRAMCAPLDEQAALAERLEDRGTDVGAWTGGLPGWANVQSGYYIYNLMPKDGGYEGLLALELMDAPEGREPLENGIWLAVQTVRAEEQEGRWVVLPQEEFRAVSTSWDSLPWYSCEELPSVVYQAETEQFTVRLEYQTTHTVESWFQDTGFLFSSRQFRTTPKPDGEWSVNQGEQTICVYTGPEEEKADIRHIGLSTAPIREEGVRPELTHPGDGEGGGSSNGGDSWGAQTLRGDWDREIWISGGGSGGLDPERYELPGAFAADLYINGTKTAELTLLPVEGGAS